MYEAQEQFFASIKPLQDAAIQTTKSFNEVAAVANDLAFDLTKRNVQFGLKLFTSGEKVLIDAVKAQQEMVNSMLKLYSGMPLMAFMPVK